MESFQNALKEARKNKNMTQEQLGALVGVSKQVVSNLERGYTTSADPGIIAKLAEILDVSPDELLTDNVKPGKPSFFFFFFDDLLKETFRTRLKKAISMKGYTQEDFVSNAPIPGNRLKEYLEGNTEPLMEDLVAISSLLEVTTDYLLGKAPESCIRSNVLLDCFYDLDEDNRDILIGEAKKLLKSQNRDNLGNAYPSNGTEGTKKVSTPPVAAGSVAL